MLPPTSPSSTRAISAVVPVFNGSATLERLTERLHAVLDQCSGRHEVILVDDGSSDDSWTVISRLAGAGADCRGIRLTRNYGQHNALLAGIRSARYPVTVTLDDDLQNPPEEIPAMVAELERGYDVVYGSPADPGHGVGRRIASRLTKLALQGAMGASVATRISAFRVLWTSLRDGFTNATGPSINLDVLLTWSATRFSTVKVRFDQRAAGESAYTTRRLVRHAFNMVTR